MSAEYADVFDRIAAGAEMLSAGYREYVRRLEEEKAERDRRIEELAARAEETALVRAELERERQGRELILASQARVAAVVEHFDGIVQQLMPAHVRARVEAVENPAERFVLAAGEMIKDTPVTSGQEDVLRARILSRVDEHLAEYPELGPMRLELIYSLEAYVRRECGIRRRHRIRALDFVKAKACIASYALPVPARMSALQMSLVRARARLGIGCGEAARRIGVNESTYCRWEMSRCRPSADNRSAVLRFLRSAGASWNLFRQVKLERASDPEGLQRLRRRAGLTLEGAGRAVGVGETTVWKLERGREVIDGRAIEEQLVAHYLGILGEGEAAEA